MIIDWIPKKGHIAPEAQQNGMALELQVPARNPELFRGGPGKWVEADYFCNRSNYIL